MLICTWIFFVNVGKSVTFTIKVSWLVFFYIVRPVTLCGERLFTENSRFHGGIGWCRRKINKINCTIKPLGCAENERTTSQRRRKKIGETEHWNNRWSAPFTRHWEIGGFRQIFFDTEGSSTCSPARSF